MAKQDENVQLESKSGKSISVDPGMKDHLLSAGYREPQPAKRAPSKGRAPANKAGKPADKGPAPSGDKAGGDAAP